MIKIEKLKEVDITAYYKLIRRVILNTSYYSKWAKKTATLRKHYYGQDFYIWEKLVK